jgi:hypothetical protein
LYGPSKGAVLTGSITDVAIVPTTCGANVTCTRGSFEIAEDWAKLFILKNSSASTTSAASCGVGGELNATLRRLLGLSTTERQTFGCAEHLEKFEQLHHFPDSLYRATWGKECPQSELLDDVENRTFSSWIAHVLNFGSW